MLKSDLAAMLVQKRGISQALAESAVDTIFKSLMDAMCKGELIELRGLGTFRVKRYEDLLRCF